MHPDALDVVRMADEAGVACVHLRTDLLHEKVDPTALVESGVGVLSVDLLADDGATYEALTGVDRFRSVMERMGAIADARPVACGLRTPWVLPRMTRCDAALGEIERFYDRWTMTLGGAVIDPLPAWAEDRVRPLPVPEPRAARLAADVVRVRCDGAVCDARWASLGLNAFEHGLVDAARLTRSGKADAPARAGSAA